MFSSCFVSNVSFGEIECIPLHPMPAPGGMCNLRFSGNGLGILCMLLKDSNPSLSVCALPALPHSLSDGALSPVG